MDHLNSPENIEQYLVDHSSREDPVLAELSRYTHLNVVHPRMLSGHVLGSFLTLFSKLTAPSRILEIGTYTGYSAICLARGLKQGGMLTTIEVNDELKDIAQIFFKKAGVDDRIKLINGNALEILPSLEGRYDLVFIDARKEDYPAYFDLVIDLVIPGGYILADNVLWGGKVLDEHDIDSATVVIREFNRKVTEDQRVENLMLPIRDGIMVIKRL